MNQAHRLAAAIRAVGLTATVHDHDRAVLVNHNGWIHEFHPVPQASTGPTCIAADHRRIDTRTTHHVAYFSTDEIIAVLLDPETASDTHPRAWHGTQPT